MRAGRNEQERTLDLAGSSLFEPVDDEVGVEHVAGCQVAVGAPVVGACRIVAGKHLASVGADAHLGRRVAVGLCECITREDEAVAVSDVGQTESSGACGAQPQAFAQERSVGEILPVERHPEPSEPLLPRERIGDDGSAVGEFLLRGRGVVPKRHVGTDRAAVHGEFEERFAVGCEQFGAVFLIEKRDGTDAAGRVLSKSSLPIVSRCSRAAAFPVRSAPRRSSAVKIRIMDKVWFYYGKSSGNGRRWL